MDVVINGQARSFPALDAHANVDALVRALGIKADRVAVEQNGDIVPRAAWQGALVAAGDRFEIVHFVGGGAL
jgi:sulfur carrier protein